jgi:hypothetical protein
LLVLQHAIATPSLHNTLQTVFNDENPRFATKLHQHIAALPGIELLHYRPIIRNRSIGPDIIPLIAKINVPTLFFADPWGYQGVSIDLILIRPLVGRHRDGWEPRFYGIPEPVVSSYLWPP